jgi:hypothetical protein
MSNNALIVFTAKSVSLILEQGGTESWALSPASMRDVRYVVCTRNTSHRGTRRGISRWQGVWLEAGEGSEQPEALSGADERIRPRL